MNYYRQAAGIQGIPNFTSVEYLTSSTALDLVVARTNYTYRIQKLVYVPTTVAAQAITVRSKTTNQKYALIPASQSTPYEVDFGEEGLPITAGEALEAVSTAGPGGFFRVEGFYKLSSVIGAHAANQ